MPEGVAIAAAQPTFTANTLELRQLFWRLDGRVDCHFPINVFPGLGPIEWLLPSLPSRPHSARSRILPLAATCERIGATTRRSTLRGARQDFPYSLC